ncbi:hypothetical protein H310_06006 [Aphanomyces invadans]|uniref:Uncharacterized protein n=1 Tax=Aphanomyces invadans TaxID=157072 RepID=A0A024U8H9_9STRA|nr:hypothetical protein H310_06006 [Aphanomyces invadans]ETW02510.1 hypothetical protein H310_06006 [Aphanomyces invadans]|eukprot:XP_008869115.1 hypothetical protein H310_06006 [Aphanomyces invadans]
MAAKARQLSEVIEIPDSPTTTRRVAKTTPPPKLLVASHGAQLDDDISRRQIEKALRRNGWKYIEGDLFGGAYCTPHVKLIKATGKLSGVNGADYFDSLESFEEHVRTTPELMNLVRREVESGNLNNEGTLTPTPAKPKKRLSYSGVVKPTRQSTEPSARSQRDVVDIRFGEIDNILTGRGWKCVDGPLGFVYCKPHVVVSGRKTKFSGEPGKDFFYGRDDVEKYVRSNPHLLKSIRDELMAPSSDSEIEAPKIKSSPATPKTKGRTTTRFSSSPKGRHPPKTNVTPKANSTSKTPPSRKLNEATKPSSHTKRQKQVVSPAMLLPPKNKHRQSLGSPADGNGGSSGAEGTSTVKSPVQTTNAGTKKRPAVASKDDDVASKKPRRAPVGSRGADTPNAVQQVPEAVAVETRHSDLSSRTIDMGHDPVVADNAEEQSSFWRCAIQ